MHHQINTTDIEQYIEAVEAGTKKEKPLESYPYFIHPIFIHFEVFIFVLLFQLKTFQSKNKMYINLPLLIKSKFCCSKSLHDCIERSLRRMALLFK